MLKIETVSRFPRESFLYKLFLVGNVTAAKKEAIYLELQFATSSSTTEGKIQEITKLSFEVKAPWLEFCKLR